MPKSLPRNQHNLEKMKGVGQCEWSTPFCCRLRFVRVLSVFAINVTGRSPLGEEERRSNVPGSEAT